MHGKRSVGRVVVFLAIPLMLLAWTGCATAPPSNVKSVDCATARIEWEVAPEVEVVSFGCAMGKQGTDPALIYTVALKNVTDRPLRYRLNIFLLDMDKAAGHLVPRKGKPPRVAPGKTETVKVPFIKTTSMPGKIHVLVVPMSE
ncbi:MAG: hypothetical protein JJV98_09320 [Desulfosarcina sp.]|nr:hypothetical protein [Desulfobacterales bacterium]